MRLMGMAAASLLLCGCMSPLMKASADGRTDRVLALIDRGADPNEFVRFNAFGHPLVFAAALGHADVVRALLEKGADPNARGDLGSALHEAAAIGSADIVKLLLARRADVDSHPFCGATPLMYAVQRGHAEIVRMLLQAGADPGVSATADCDSSVFTGAAVIPEGRTALALAEEGGDAAILALLRPSPPAGDRSLPELLLRAVEKGAESAGAVEKAVRRLK